jgi:hypothetical protein
MMVLLTANLYRPSPSSASMVPAAGAASEIRACRMLLIMLLFQLAVLSCW